MVRTLPENAQQPRGERAVNRHERRRSSSAAAGPVSSTGGMTRRLLEMPSGGGNTVLKLRLREIGGLRGRTPPPSPNTSFCAEKFRHFKLQEEFNVCADMEFPRMANEPITTITVANDIIFVIDWIGSCYAFRHNANGSISPYERYGLLRSVNRPYEQIEIVFYNKINDSVIIVSSFSTDVGYYLRVLSLETIRNDNWEVGIEVFGPQAKVLPFFDDCNHIAVVSTTFTGTVNNVYEMSNYNTVHTIDGKIHSIMKRPGVLIVGFVPTPTYLPIVVFSTENWSILKKMDYSNITPSRIPQFNEIHNENILLKETGNMQIIDIWNHYSAAVIKRTKYVRQFLCFDLTANNLLLKLDNDKAAICNSRGLQVSLLEDNEVTGYKSNICFSNMVVTMDKNYAIFYSMKKSKQKPRDGATHEIQGSINICSTFNGKSIRKINPCNDVDPMVDIQKRGGSIHEALKDVTALCYDEKHHKIYTGNNNGFLHVWSN